MIVDGFEVDDSIISVVDIQKTVIVAKSVGENLRVFVKLLLAVGKRGEGIEGVEPLKPGCGIFFHAGATRKGGETQSDTEQAKYDGFPKLFQRTPSLRVCISIISLKCLFVKNETAAFRKFGRFY